MSDWDSSTIFCIFTVSAGFADSFTGFRFFGTVFGVLDADFGVFGAVFGVLDADFGVFGTVFGVLGVFGNVLYSLAATRTAACITMGYRPLTDH